MAILTQQEHAQRHSALGVGGDVLILSHHRDISAIAVQVALERLGVTPLFLPINLFPFSGEHSLRFDQRGSSAEILMPSFDEVSGLGSVWFRRRAPTRVFDYAKPWSDEDFRRRTLTAYTLSFYEFLQTRLSHARWVNHPAAASRANSKMVQLDLAPSCGLTIPETLVSNAPDEIRRFLSENSGHVIVKSLIPYTIQGDGHTKQIMTVRVPPGAQFHDETLSGQVSIYQIYTQKAYEIRLLIFSDHAYALRIDSVKEGEQTVDWRTMTPSKGHFSAVEVPGNILRASKELMAKLGIVFGCFDFVVTPEGEFIFLEVNESGDFLWMEECAPEYNILSRFAAWLAQMPQETGVEDLQVLNVVGSSRFKEIEAQLAEHAKREPDQSVKDPF